MSKQAVYHQPNPNVFSFFFYFVNLYHVFWLLHRLLLALFLMPKCLYVDDPQFLIFEWWFAITSSRLILEMYLTESKYIEPIMHGLYWSWIAHIVLYFASGFSNAMAEYELNDHNATNITFIHLCFDTY